MNPPQDSTPAAPATRHTPEPWRVELFTTTFRVVGPRAELIAEIDSKCGFDKARARANEIADSHNELAGLRPEAVAGLVAAAEAVVAQDAGQEPYNGIDLEPLRAALAALKGGAK